MSKMFSKKLSEKRAPSSKGQAQNGQALAGLLRAIELFQSGQLADCLAVLQGLKPNDLDPAQCSIAGLIFLSAERDEEALKWLDGAARLPSPPPGTQARRALALQRLKRSQEALAAYEQAIARQDLDATGFYQRGNLLRDLNRRDEAIASYDAALRLNPAFPEALHAGGVMLQENGDYKIAGEFFSEAVRLKPDFAQAWFALANVMQALKQHDEAIKTYDIALSYAPGYADILTNKAAALYDIGGYEEAIASCDEALKTQPGQPQTLLNRANALLKLQQPERTLEDCAAALKFLPDYFLALNTQGIALRDLGRFEEAIAAYSASAEQAPDFAHARVNRGEVLLLTGNFAEGWEDYEYRWINGQPLKRELNLPLAEWEGETKAGDRILVFDEQGLGDVLQYCRYLPLLAERGAVVTFLVRKKLHRLLATLAGNIRLIDLLDDSAYDYQVSMSSLPRLFKTRFENVPNGVPYLHADGDRVAAWRAQLGDGFKAGLCWHGNQDFRADRSRSIPLIDYEPLACVKDVRLISLQVGEGALQIDALPNGFRLETLGADFDTGPDAFLDAAAVIAQLDLVITCDTSVAHLAGALGKPVWLLVKDIPDWRWFLDRDDSPWYPSMRIFRRRKGEDWRDLMQRVAEALTVLRRA